MGNLDFSDPQVLSNYVMSRCQEGHGKITLKSIYVFQDDDGHQYVLPEHTHIPEYMLPKKELEKEEVKEEKKEEQKEPVDEIKEEKEEVKPMTGKDALQANAWEMPENPDADTEVDKCLDQESGRYKHPITGQLYDRHVLKGMITRIIKKV